MVALAGQLGLDFLIGFDDAVVHAHNGHVVAAVGMGVVLGGLTVGGPARMANAAAARKRLLPEQHGEVGKLPLSLAERNFFAVEHRNACGVISAIGQRLKPFQQNGDAGLPAGISHDAAHMKPSPFLQK